MAIAMSFSRRPFLTEILSKALSTIISGSNDDLPPPNDSTEQSEKAKAASLSASLAKARETSINALKANSTGLDRAKSNLISAETDSVSISLASQLKSAVEALKRQGANARLNIKIRSKASRKELVGAAFSSAGDAKLQRDLDLILRFMSKDEDEYKNLKTQFENLFSKTPATPSIDGKSASASMSTFESFEASLEVKLEVSTEISSYESLLDLSKSGQPMTLAQMKSLKSYAELSLSFQVKRSSNTITLEEMGVSDPIVLDLANEGLKLTKANDKANFDINADGKTDKTGWVSGNTAILCCDKNNNGLIDNGKELFGDQNGEAHGFAELAKYDANNDKKIDKLDPIYKKLKLYRDLNGDGKITQNEFSSLEELKIKSISLEYTKTNEKINGNIVALKGTFERNDNSKGQTADVFFAYA